MKNKLKKILMAALVLTAAVPSQVSFAWNEGDKNLGEESVVNKPKATTAIEGKIIKAGDNVGSADSPEAKFDITVPTSALFGSSESLGGRIVSPKYVIKNNSDTTKVDVYIHKLSNPTDDISGLELNLIKEKDKFELRNSKDEFLGSAIDEKKIETIDKSSNMEFELAGMLPSTYDYSTDATPKYSLEFRFVENHK